LVLDEGEWSVSCPSLFTSGERSQYSPDRSLGGHQSRSGPCEAAKNLLPLPGIEPRPSRLVARRHIDWDIRCQIIIIIIIIIKTVITTIMKDTPCLYGPLRTLASLNNYAHASLIRHT
jgi:hypothetical protein